MPTLRKGFRQILRDSHANRDSMAQFPTVKTLDSFDFAAVSTPDKRECRLPKSLKSWEYVFQALHAALERLDARHPVACTPQMPAEFSHEPDGFLQGGRRFRQNRRVVGYAIKRPVLLDHPPVR